MFTTIALAAALVSAAPVTLDVTALGAGQLPAVGTREEADSCAAESMYMFFAFMSSTKISEADREANIAAPMRAWTERAAAFRPMTAKAYMNDQAFVDAVMSMSGIEADTHFDLQKACTERLKAPQT